MARQTPHRTLLAGLTAIFAAGVIAASGWAVSRESGPTQSDGPAIAAKLAKIGIYAHVTDRGFQIRSSSMEPTLHCVSPGPGCVGPTDDHVLVRAYGAATPSRGDIVAMNAPARAIESCGNGGVYLKRLIGMPGNTWAEKDGVVYIDGQPVREPYIKSAYRDHYSYPARKIPAGKYFVLGDNRVGSCDSRKWGDLPSGNIIGKVIAIYWPLARIRRP